MTDPHLDYVRYSFAIVIGLCAIIVFSIVTNWVAALCLFCYLWADNLGRPHGGCDDTTHQTSASIHAQP